MAHLFEELQVYCLFVEGLQGRPRLLSQESLLTECHWLTLEEGFLSEFPGGSPVFYRFSSNFTATLYLILCRAS